MNRLLLLFLLPFAVFAQPDFGKNADSLYKAKNYTNAGWFYLMAAKSAEFKPMKMSHYYNAACCYALSGKTDSAFILLNLAKQNGYKNGAHLKVDTDLDTLHKLPAWQPLVNAMDKISSASTQDPAKAKLVTTDVKNFWQAYDLAQKDTTNRYDIYQKYYVDAGSDGLQDYFAYKVRSLKNFVAGHDKRPKFYAAIRKNTFLVDAQKPQMMASFANFKKLYPDAKFPNVYFVIGSFSSGGTSTDNGLLIGLDQAVRTPDIPTDELTLWQQNNFSDLKKLPYVVAHELIHFNQKGTYDTTLLHAVLVEGMADFIGELICGHNANERLHVWAKGKEKQVWADFKKEVYLNRANNWIANGNQETADKPADLGYWAGYQICKAYYNKSVDKKQAIKDMLVLKDDKVFYEKSGAEHLFD